MRSRHKNTKHLMILAFFNVVASSQISPHTYFRAAKVHKHFIYAKSFCEVCNMLSKFMVKMFSLGRKVCLKVYQIDKICYLRRIKLLLN